MSCLLPVIAGMCLMQPSDLYISGELQPVELSTPWQKGTTEYDARAPYPFGGWEVGMSRNRGRWAIEYGYGHSSSAPVNDEGRDFLFARFRFRPFGGL